MKRNKPIPANPDKEIVKLLQSAQNQSSGQSLRQVFVDWLELSMAATEMLPEHLYAAITTRSLAADNDKTKALWEKAKTRYRPQAFQDFSAAYGILTDFAGSFDPQSSSSVYGPDIVGHIYEEHFTGRHNQDQFWTPWDICLLMAQMSHDPQMLQQRILDAIRAELKEETAKSALLIACGLTLTACQNDVPLAGQQSIFTRYVIPAVKDRIEPITINDPACGSGRTLLAAGYQYPGWAFREGLVQLYGQDIDPTCVLMTQLNLNLCGMGDQRAARMMAEIEYQMARADNPASLPANALPANALPANALPIETTTIAAAAALETFVQAQLFA